MQKSVIYIRVSEGEDINKQINAVIDYANANNYLIAQVFIDFDKDGVNKRKMIEFLKTSDVSNILVFSMDRLTRKIEECVSYEELGFKIIIAQEIEVIPAISMV